MLKTRNPGNQAEYPEPHLHARKDNRLCIMNMRIMTQHDIA